MCVQTPRVSTGPSDASPILPQDSYGMLNSCSRVQRRVKMAVRCRMYLLAIWIAAALGTLTAPVEASAKGAGFSGRGIVVSPKAGRWQTFRGLRYDHSTYGYPSYPGFNIASQPIGGEPVELTSQPFGPVTQPSYVLQCDHSEEIKVVPSEAGGTREIKISRC
jgi:hypothetical protein